MSPSTSPQSPAVYTVTGMSCSHCAVAVREEVSEVAGVESVEVDLATGHLEVIGDGVSDEAVAAAVEEAGYRVES